MAEEQKLNLDDEFSFEIKPTKSTVAAVAAGILVVLAGFLAYNIFSKPAAPQTLTPEQAGQTAQPATGENQATPNAAAGDNGTGLTTPEQTTQPTPQNQTGTSTPETTVATSTAWVPLAHTTGSISGTEYTVKSGDTLWEIAQGRYGSGYEWFRIAEANGIVNNEQGHPLIYPGQVLKLPE